ncbi:MAG: pyridoxal phosphate-dependent aminotransferase [Fibrobacter sp.]|uniref:pyridoxal phosphate-dependent aminotransferase n=1 Tax=Fibrobacter sp. TaxID=35828 RepID=UPI0025C1C9F3|nr:pyridoxal phosphate-dependent aminotransferase [Fibrobacter sp.]MBQ7078665.1 pyridoxal phosphate-dependent aminotransferase [Fibrobacter sp.]
MLSSRLPKDLTPSPFFAELERAKAEVLAECAGTGGNVAECLPFIDMTVSSPLRVGLPFDLQPAVEQAKSEFGTWVADAAGRRDAREAVVEYYRERGGAFTAGQIILTASTSEAYSVLFKTFCDPGDVILTPMPGYPLLDTLAQLEHLECAPYFLKIRRENARKLATDESVEGAGGRNDKTAAKNNVILSGAKNPVKSTFRFVLDSDSLLAAPERAKILLLVSPHNPTGHCVSREEWNEAVRFCEENNMILVVDEVFADYAFSDKVSRTWQYVLDERRETRDESADVILDPGVRSTIGEGIHTSSDCDNSASKDLWDAGGGDFINLPEDGPKCPIFWLNGLSKAVGSPQLKLGWMAFYAPREHFEEIRAALEFVEDAYLSVSSPAQSLARPTLAVSAAYESRIRERLLQNWQTLREAFPSKYCPEVLGGWYAVVRLGEDDEEITLRLLREKHVLVQPGFFFDFDEDGWVVISLLQEPAQFQEAIDRIKQ